MEPVVSDAGGAQRARARARAMVGGNGLLPAANCLSAWIS